MREFKEIIFYGSGDSAEIEADQWMIHKSLDEAFTRVSGLQQPAHPESDADWVQACRDCRDGWREVEDVVRDIAMALTGQEIKFKGRMNSTQWTKSLNKAKRR